MKYRLYTDGSCNNLSPYGEGGYAYVIVNDKDNIVYQYSNCELNVSNNIMELKAIIEGCRMVPDDCAHLTVVSDSQYALNVLSGRWKAKANVELINKFNVKDYGFKIDFAWVKGHNGNKMNELADEMANSEMENLRIREGIPVYDNTNSPKVKNKSMKRWTPYRGYRTYRY